MLKKIIVMLLIVMVSNFAVFALGSKKQDDAAKVRAEIAKLGIGRDAKVTVQLKDGKKIKGYVSETKADSFVVTDSKTLSQTEVQYSDVSKVKGQNIPAGASIAIAVGVAVGIIFLLGAILKN